MTRADILALPTGPELDRLGDEHICGGRPLPLSV